MSNVQRLFFAKAFNNKNLKKMKRISVWTLFCLFALLVITSCQKENIDTIVETEDTITPITTTFTPPANALLSRASSEEDAETEGVNLDCITIVFPFSLLDSEGVIHEVEHEAAFADLLSEDGDTSVYIVDFVYPINVSLNDRDVVQIADSEELGAIFAECIPDGGWNENVFPAYLIDDENSCYKTVYPISLEDADDGTIITVEDEATFIDLLVEKEVYFHFPINLTDGETIIPIANVDELFNTLFSCNEYYEDSTAWDWEEGFEYLYCFQVNFPLNVVVADGGEKTVNNHEELCELMLQGVLVDYAYPMTLTSPEGEEVIANSAEELELLLEQCDGFIGEGDESDVFLLTIFSQPFGEDSTTVCYTVNYPISGTYVDTVGETQTIVFDNVEEIWEAEIAELSLVYPVNITQQSDGQVITLNNLEALFEVVDACNDGL